MNLDVAFHFLAEIHGDSYGLPIEEEFFRALLSAPDQGGRIELGIGDLLLHKLAMRREDHGSVTKYWRDSEREERALQDWLASRTNITSLDEVEARTAATQAGTFVIAAFGLDSLTLAQVNGALRNGTSYIGFLELDEESVVHTALYRELLPFKYSYERRALGIFHSAFDSEDRSEKQWLEDHWVTFGFASIAFEDLGVRQTVFEEEGVLEELIDHIKHQADNETEGDDGPAQ